MIDRFSPAFDGRDEPRAARVGVLERELAPAPSSRFSPADRPLECVASVVHEPLLSESSDAERFVRSGT